ncbi:acyloxyacyl hydrolase [Gracilimonas mengyeensis]|uniref:acyloxyacyl hydrolase n=1 Tax=Gracilimonas mengyeensis TaxID=1302730 RepID=UPI001FEA57B3|nr:acyloxyacyl hydrolase [Gracilimonas mengyeensis]
MKKFHGEGNVYYTTDLIPYVHFDYPKRDENDRRVSRNGFGVSPVGFMWKEDELDTVVPFAQISGGLIYMESEFPTDLSRKLNFTFDITVGTDIKVGSIFEFSLGYKFHHISNAETGKHNPGLDSNFLFLSISTQ